MNVAIVTGALGLVGAESVRFFASKGFYVVGIDNDRRGFYFGKDGSVMPNLEELKKEVPNYEHIQADIQDIDTLVAVFQKYRTDIKLVVHAAAQPSHNFSSTIVFTDFKTNALGTLNMLRATAEFCPNAVFIYVSTSKVYGDTPNKYQYLELDKRWMPDHHSPSYKNLEYGFSESTSIDQSTHTPFGVSKLSGDLMVQEHGRYFGLKTVCFRSGCIVGPRQTGVRLHGFLSYLVKCGVNGDMYTIYGHKGKQVRDNIHVTDLVNAFWEFYQNPKNGEVYNIGGGNWSNCSVLESIGICEDLTGKKFKHKYDETPRVADHIWWISDIRKFMKDYPNWRVRHNSIGIITELVEHHEKVKYATLV